jgi:hypothetical protein
MKPRQYLRAGLLVGEFLLMATLVLAQTTPVAATATTAKSMMISGGVKCAGGWLLGGRKHAFYTLNKGGGIKFGSQDLVWTVRQQGYAPVADE